MSTKQNLVIIIGEKFRGSLEKFLEFKRYFFNIPEDNIITTKEIERSNFYKDIKEADLIQEVIDEYKKVIDDTNLNPIQLEGKARHCFKLSRAIKAKLMDLYQKNLMDRLILIGNTTHIPLFCYFWEGEGPQGNNIQEIYFSDLHYVNFSENKDSVDVPMGRISISSNFRLKEILNKTFKFEQKIHEYIKSENKENADSEWMKQVILISDPIEIQSESIYENIMENVFNSIQNKNLVIRRFEKDFSEEELLEEFNSGSSICLYFGRGEKIGWSIENGLHNGNIRKLSNEFKLPVIFSNCPNAGAIQYEKEKIFLQEILNWKNGGCIFAVGSSGLSNPYVYEKTNLSFFTSIFENKLNHMGEIIQFTSNQFLNELMAENEDTLDNVYYEEQKKFIFNLILNGDPTVRIPFNLPESEDDAPYEIIIPEEPIEKPDTEKLFQEWKQKISNSILKKLYLPLDFLRNINLDSYNIGDYIEIIIRNLYEGKKKERIEIPQSQNAELTYYTEDEIQNASREAPVAYEEKTYTYPIEGTDEESDCPDCEGSGRLDCEYCDGGITPGGNTCSVCEGVGTIECERCEGTGKIVNLDILLWKWKPVFDKRGYSSFEIDLKKQMRNVSPEGTNFILRLDKATLDDFGGNEELFNKTMDIYKELKSIADDRTEYGGLEILDIELQRSEADHAPVVELCCKYKEKDFDVYIIGELDRKYVFKSPNIPKSFTLIGIILGIIIAIIVLIIILSIIF